MTSGEKNKRIVWAAIIAIFSAVLLWFVFPPVFVAFSPFLVAAVIAKLIEPIVNFLSNKARVPRKIAAFFMVLFAILLLGWGISVILINLWQELSSLLENGSEIFAWISDVLISAQNFIDSYLGWSFSSYVSDFLSSGRLWQMFSSHITSLIGPAVMGTVSVAKAMPSIFVFTIALILGTYFISSDERFFDRIFKVFPKTARNYFSSFRKNIGSALTGYIKAQLILLCITFIELFIGFLIIGGEVGSYAFLLALVMCIVDALPIFGTGLFLIPWSLISFFTGDIRMGLSLIILYGVCLVMRQILEPRVIGDRIGLHPLITLMSIYAGLQFFGVIGMFLGPITVITLKFVFTSGLLSDLWSYITTGQVPKRPDGTEEEQ